MTVAPPLRWACILREFYGGYDMLVSPGQCFRGQCRGVFQSWNHGCSWKRNELCCAMLYCAVVPLYSLYTFYLLQACVAVFSLFLAWDKTAPQRAFPSIVTWASTSLRLYLVDVLGITPLRTLAMHVSCTTIPCVIACVVPNKLLLESAWHALQIKW